MSMKQLLDKLDGQTIRGILKDSGLLLIVGGAMYYMLTGFAAEMRDHNQTTAVQNEKVVEAINQNTDAIRQMTFWISNGRAGKGPLQSGTLQAPVDGTRP